MPTIPITFTMGALPQGVQFTTQEYADAIAARLIGSVENIGFQNGGPEPTSDVGPWLKNGNQWRFWNPITGKYDLGVFDPGDIMPTGRETIDETRGWLLCDGRQFDVDQYPLLWDAIKYNFNLSSDNSGGVPIDNTKFRIPDGRERYFTGATNASQVGDLVGNNSIVPGWTGINPSPNPNNSKFYPWVGIDGLYIQELNIRPRSVKINYKIAY